MEGRRVSESKGIAITTSRESSLAAESDFAELSLSPSTTSFLLQLPHLVPTRRNRTPSACQRASDATEVRGHVTLFLRERGHGFIAPLDSQNPDDKLFMHVSDVEGDIVPMVGDEVQYRPLPLPPKNDKMQATHVRIVKMIDDKHFTWDGQPVPCQMD